MSKQYFKKNLSILLATLLLSGCGRFSGLPFEEMSSAPKKEETSASQESAAASETLPSVPETEAETETEASAEDISPVNSYAYSLLPETEQPVYREILSGLLSGMETKLSTLEDDVLKKVYKFVLYDHPEIFYTDGFRYSSESIGDTRISLSFIPQYTEETDQRALLSQQLENAVTAALTATPTGSDYEKALYAFDWVVGNTAYDESAENGQNVLSVFLDQKSVCSGYAKAFQLLLQRMGIPAVLLTGTARGGSHAWVAAKLGESWCLFDPTWGEPGLNDTELSAEDSFVNHTYFGLTAEEMSKDHSALGDLPVPDCSDESFNFFRQTGSFFTSCDMEALRTLFRQTRESNASALQFRCDSEELRKEFLHELLDNQMVYRFLNGLRASYFVNDGLNVVTFLMKS